LCNKNKILGSSSRTLKSVRTCYCDIRTDASLNYSKLLDTDGSPNDILMSSKRMFLTDERPNALLGRPDGNKGSDFSELESAQNLHEISEIAFLKLVTLLLIIIRLFPCQIKKIPEYLKTP